MKILIADDHRLVIEAVKAKLSEIEPGIEFVLAMSVTNCSPAPPTTSIWP